MAKKRPKTYEVEHDGRKVRVTVPERHDHVAYEGDAAEVLRDVLKDNLSPQAVAALANAIRVQLNSRAGLASGDWRVWRQQLRWLSDLLVEMLGGEEAYRQACDEAGL